MFFLVYQKMCDGSRLWFSLTSLAYRFSFLHFYSWLSLLLGLYFKEAGYMYNKYLQDFDWNFTYSFSPSLGVSYSWTWVVGSEGGSTVLGWWGVQYWLPSIVSENVIKPLPNIFYFFINFQNSNWRTKHSRLLHIARKIQPIIYLNIFSNWRMGFE